MLGDAVLLERARQHGLVLAGDRRRAGDRVRAGPAAACPDPRATLLPGRVPAAADAVAGRGVVDDRQVHARVPLRPRVAARARAGMGGSGVLRQRRILAKVTMMVLDAWIFIPFMMIMILAGLQALPGEVIEAGRVDGASGWQNFWKIVFPLMLPVTITAFIVRLIFKLKLADIVINITSGGPGGATDTVTSFIYREYRDRSNVGYGTLLAMFYLVVIVIALTGLMRGLQRWMRPYS